MLFWRTIVTLAFRWSFKKTDFTEPDMSRQIGIASSSPVKQLGRMMRNKIKNAFVAPGGDSKGETACCIRKQTKRIDLNNWAAFVQYGMTIGLVVTGFFLLMCTIPEDYTESDIEAMSFIGITCVVLGELFLFTIHPFAICGMVMKGAITIGYSTREMLEECNMFAIKAELDLASAFVREHDQDTCAHFAYVTCAALETTMLHLQEQLGYADLPIASRRSIAQELDRRITEYRINMKKEARFGAHYQLRVLAAASTAEVSHPQFKHPDKCALQIVSSGAAFALSREKRSQVSEHAGHSESLAEWESADQADGGCAPETPPSELVESVLIGDPSWKFDDEARVMWQETVECQHSDTPPFMAEHEDGVKKVLNAIETFVNFQEHLRLSMEVCF